MKKISQKKLNIILSASALVIMWAVWLIAYRIVDNGYLIPSFSDTAVALWECVKDASFWRAFFATLSRTLISFVISFLLAALLCALSVALKPSAAVIKPFVVLFRTVPTIAVILLLVVWTNARITPIIVAFLVSFPMLYSQLTAAVDGIDCGLVEMAEVYNLSRREKVFKIYAPQISPQILAHIGPDISLGLKVTVSAEVIANTFVSLGGMMQNARAFVEMPRLAALTVVCVLAGLAIELIFSSIGAINGKWRSGK